MICLVACQTYLTIGITYFIFILCLCLLLSGYGVTEHIPPQYKPQSQSQTEKQTQQMKNQSKSQTNLLR